MSVRRLAEPAVQPASFAFTEANAAWAQNTIGKYPKGREQSAVIPLLMRAQEQEGWVTRAAIERIADMLGMPYIRVLEVATFYTQYQLAPVGTKAHVQVCGTTPCMLRGSEDLMEVCRSKIHHDQFHTNAAGTLSWEEVECLGACVNAPMVMIFKDTYEDLTPERLAEIIDEFEAGRGGEVKPGPQIDRVYAAPVGGLTSLTEDAVIVKGKARREPKAPAAAGGGATVAPSNAAKPKTDAAETNPAIKSPSPVKVSPSTEKAASVTAPAHSETAADTAIRTDGKAVKPRSHAAPKATEPAKLAELPAAEPEGKAAPKPSLYDPSRPKAIERPAEVDDLRLISGIGPKIEGTLNSLGIFTYAQIAAWTKKERDWVDAYLSFRGRIERDDWVKQAKALAKGGVTEYIRVFGKKPV